MQDNNQQSLQAVQSGLADKEKEAIKAAEVAIEEVREPEPSVEVAKHVIKKKEEIEIAPDLRKMGVKAPAATTSVSDVATTSLKLPLTDDQIALGLQAQILSSLRWLAEWCLRQLKKAHLHLKKIHGHFVKVKD